MHEEIPRPFDRLLRQDRRDGKRKAEDDRNQTQHQVDEKDSDCSADQLTQQIRAPKRHVNDIELDQVHLDGQIGQLLIGPFSSEMRQPDRSKPVEKILPHLPSQQIRILLGPVLIDEVNNRLHRQIQRDDAYQYSKPAPLRRLHRFNQSLQKNGVSRHEERQYDCQGRQKAKLPFIFYRLST